METAAQVVEREMKRAFEKGGIAGCQELMWSQLSEWQGMLMNIAIIGPSGVGKSSLINALLGLNADDTGGAKVGSNETTIISECYRHPNNEQLKLWDLPGVGTPAFPQHNYMQEIEPDKYDFFLLVTSGRFCEIDVWLATELTKKGKGYFFVRTHMANEVADDKKAHPRSHTEAKLVGEVRANTETQLRKLWTTSPENMRVFLIDSYEQEKYDFSDLELQLIGNFPELKREALLLTLRTRNRAMIDQKAECLRSRIWKSAASSAGIAMIPIPGTSFAADVAILVCQTKFYYQQFGLDTESLKRLAQQRGVNYSELEEVVTKALGVEFLELGLCPANYFKLISALGISLTLFEAESVAEAAVSLIPGVGTVLASSMSYLTTSWLLGKILEKMHAFALEVYDVPAERLAAGYANCLSTDRS